jgi:exodeoxyribonuclease VII large subunit
MAELIRERQILKPVQLNALARDLLEGSFAQVWVQGEISNFSRPGSGHLYFTLKDDRAQVRCALFKQKAMYLRFAPRDGLQVLVRGRLTVYEARGEYQLVLEHMEEAGEGALRQAFEALKLRLAAEGLFAVERKRALPRFVRHLGLITSARGAAVRDVISVLARRFPLLEIDVLPVAVQGQGAAAEIRDMLVRAAASGRYDVLLLTRGGGSLEDLWAFNDEALARAIVASVVPVVSAVGHEIDFSLADFAADLRAPTPSAAAELLAPDRLELLAHLAQLRRRLDAAMVRRLTGLAQRSDQAGLRLQALRPQLRLERGAHRLALLRSRLDNSLFNGLGSRIERLRRLAQALDRQHPRERMSAHRHRAQLLEQRLSSTIRRALEQKTTKLQGLARALGSVNPFATLSRGYAIVRDPVTGNVLRRSQDAQIGQALDAQLAEGVLGVVVSSRKR